MTDILVTYDIATADNAGQRLLARVAQTCEGYGIRVQHSVFECRLNDAKLERLRAELLELIRPTTDSIRIYRFQGDILDSTETYGRTGPIGPGSTWIL